MRKKLFLVIGFVLAVSPVWAVQQMARFAEPTMENFYVGGGRFPNQMMRVDYIENQSNTTNQAVVQGRCAAVPGSSAYATKQVVELTNEAAGSANKYCWCQLIFPFVSSYVFSPRQDSPSGADFTNAAVCSRYCTLNCANYVHLFRYMPMDFLYY